MRKVLIILMTLLVSTIMSQNLNDDSYISDHYMHIGIYNNELYYYVQKPNNKLLSSKNNGYIMKFTDNDFQLVKEIGLAANITMINSKVYYVSKLEVNENSERKNVVYDLETQKVTEFYGLNMYTRMEFISEKYIGYYLSYNREEKIYVYSFDKNKVIYEQEIDSTMYHIGVTMYADDDFIYISYNDQDTTSDHYDYVINLSTFETTQNPSIDDYLFVAKDDSKMYVIGSNFPGGTGIGLLVQNSIDTQRFIKELYNGELYISGDKIIIYDYTQNAYRVFNQQLEETRNIEKNENCDYSYIANEEMYICITEKELGAYNSRFYRRYSILSTYNNEVIQETDWVLIGKEEDQWAKNMIFN